METGERCAAALADLKERLGFSAPLDLLEKRFLLTDHVRAQGFVSTRFESQIVGRVTAILRSWADFLNGLLLPNPQSQAMLREAQALTDQQREHASAMIARLMLLVRRGDSAVFFADDRACAAVIDEALALVDGDFMELMRDLTPALIDAWEKPPELEERPFYG